MDYQRHRPNYEKCVICGQRKALDYFTRGGLCDRKCEDCVGKDYVPEFVRLGGGQGGDVHRQTKDAGSRPETQVKTLSPIVTSPAATFAVAIAVTAATSFAVGFYVASAIASSQVLEALSR